MALLVNFPNEELLSMDHSIMKLYYLQWISHSTLLNFRDEWLRGYNSKSVIFELIKSKSIGAITKLKMKEYVFEKLSLFRDLASFSCTFLHRKLFVNVMKE